MERQGSLPSFRAIASEDRARISSIVQALLTCSKKPNLRILANSLGKNRSELWQDICNLAGVLPCGMPNLIDTLKMSIRSKGLAKIRDDVRGRMGKEALQPKAAWAKSQIKPQLPRPGGTVL